MQNKQQTILKNRILLKQIKKHLQRLHRDQFLGFDYSQEETYNGKIEHCFTLRQRNAVTRHICFVGSCFSMLQDLRSMQNIFDLHNKFVVERAEKTFLGARYTYMWNVC